jgi:hypothetical protein
MGAGALAPAPVISCALAAAPRPNVETMANDSSVREKDIFMRKPSGCELGTPEL